MADLTFKQAVKEKLKARIALCGPAGSGKSFSALKILTAMGCKKIAVVDSEASSALRYADVFKFDHLPLDIFDPRLYTEALVAAGKGGYDGLIVDGISHEWQGRGGALDTVDSITARGGVEGGKFGAWRHVTPLHNMFVDAMLRSPFHLIATLRTKMEYRMEEDPITKKIKVVKVGTQPIQREGMEYEFDVVGDLDVEHRMVISKTRCSALDGKIFSKPGQEFADILLPWLEGGKAIALVTLEQVAQFKLAIVQAKINVPDVKALMANQFKVTQLADLRADQAEAFERELLALAQKS